MELISVDSLEKRVLSSIRNMPNFPFKTGHLKWDATYSIRKVDGFDVVFDTTRAHYIDFLEYGTRPHLITNAFGRGITVKHPGSTKHVGFISKKAVSIAVETICKATGGIVINEY